MFEMLPLPQWQVRCDQGSVLFDNEDKDMKAGDWIRLAKLAEMVLDMKARQIEVYKMEKMARYASGKVDRDTYEQAVYELKRLQSQAEEECRDILGMEEEQ